MLKPTQTKTFEKSAANWQTSGGTGILLIQKKCKINWKPQTCKTKRYTLRIETFAGI